MSTASLGQVTAQPGRPLYLSVRDAVRTAIDAGLFKTGQRMPSTKELSEQMSVSLVTAHRAMRELVESGVLQRTQGKGTFVHQRYSERQSDLTTCRVGLVFHREASLADHYHGQVLEGVRQAANQLGVDMMLLRFGEDVRNECDGYLYVNPLPAELEAIAVGGNNRPNFVVGARPRNKKVCSIDVDNIDIGRQAVMHLASLGHRNIAYVGGADDISNSADRWTGFTQAGYHYALDVYSAAGTLGLRLPDHLSVVGVDDPPSAPHLSPSLTTLRQPLTQLGHAAVSALFAQINRSPGETPAARTLWAELVIRRSSMVCRNESRESRRGLVTA